MRELKGWVGRVDASVEVPGDKSLTHRAILLAAMGRGDMVIKGWLDAADTRSSLGVAQAFGAQLVEAARDRLVLRSVGEIQEPTTVLDCGNSGTTMRLATGIAAGSAGLVVLAGDASLSRRPMARVVDPLSELGLTICSRRGGLAPLAVQGGAHRGGQFALPVASAQVKSALLLAGLSADGVVTVREPILSRDHTERMIAAMGGTVAVGPEGVSVTPSALTNIEVEVPGDPSSAAFWCAIAALAPERAVTVRNMLFNPTRTGFFRVLENMGCPVSQETAGTIPEPFGAVTVASGRLSALRLDASDIPAMVDEVPLAALLATQAEGTTVITGAQELRVKESDRIHVTAEILQTMGAQIVEQADGWIIQGPTELHGGAVDARGDHRMAMLAAVAATAARGPVYLSGDDSVAISYPGFFSQYETLARTAAAAR